MGRTKVEKKEKVVLSKENLLVQPLSLTLLGINPSVIGNRVSIAIVKRLQEAFKQIITGHKQGGKEWKQLSLFDTDDVKNKYLGDNKIVFDIHINELVDDPKHWQDAYNTACQLADVVVYVANKEGKVVRDHLFTLIFNSNHKEIRKEDGSIIYKYEKNTRPIIGFAIERATAEYIFSFQKRYGEFLDYPALVANDKYYPPIYTYIAGCRATRGDTWEEDYTEFRRILGFEDAKVNGEWVFNRYKVFTDFKKKVLLPVQKSMKENADSNLSDIWFEFESITLHGRAANPDKLRFTVHVSPLGEAIKSDRIDVKETMELEKRLRDEFRQNERQVRALMKRVNLSMRPQLAEKMNELSDLVRIGKITIETDASRYWNKTFSNFIDELNACIEENKNTIVHFDGTNKEHLSLSDPPTDILPLFQDQDQDTFQEMLCYVRSRIEPKEYNTWFSHLQMDSFKGDKLTVIVPTKTFVELLEMNHGELFMEAIKATFGKNAMIEYRLNNKQ